MILWYQGATFGATNCISKVGTFDLSKAQNPVCNKSPISQFNLSIRSISLLNQILGIQRVQRGSKEKGLKSEFQQGEASSHQRFYSYQIPFSVDWCIFRQTRKSISYKYSYFFLSLSS
jgi:hypothetical protein